jgi:ABC-type lipoprotein release transport system permease subunit
MTVSESSLRRTVVFEGIRLVMIGMTVGVAAAVPITPLMRSLLFGVEAHDLAVMECAVAVLGTAALLATYVPAYRATRVDPVTALRWEYGVKHAKTLCNSSRFCCGLRRRIERDRRR